VGGLHLENLFLATVDSAIESYPDGKIKIEADDSATSLGHRNLTKILGYRSSNALSNSPHVSNRSVDINEGLKYITVSCNAVNREYNINSEGKRSTVDRYHPTTFGNHHQIHRHRKRRRTGRWEIQRD
jgi:hypothetical protein